MPTLLTPIRALPGVGPVSAKKFSQLGLGTLEDALFYFPFRHEDWRHVTTIERLRAGDTVTVRVTIEALSARPAFRRRRMNLVEARVTDDSGASISIVWFNQPYLAKTLKPGDSIYASGQVRTNRQRLQLVNPAFEKPSADPLHQKLVPVYRAVEGLSQRTIRGVIKQAVELVDLLPESLPQPIIERFALAPRNQALRDVHFPPALAEAKRAVARLKFEELLAWYLRWRQAAREMSEAVAPALTFHESEIQSFVRGLPFTLTDDQRVATWQILQDTGRTNPMYRLLQGDVGSGKTVVAAIVAYNAALNKHQTVVLSPTSILAEQHWQTFTRLLAGREVTVALLTAEAVRLNTAAPTLSRPAFLQAVADGQIDIVIATHAVLNADVRFGRPGLVIVDEQQRFGVRQRQELLRRQAAGEQVRSHFLSMTATPIPRTVALFMTGALELSRLRHKPANRAPIQSRVIGPAERDTIVPAMNAAIDRGEQVYVVTPLIEESDVLGVRAATSEFRRLTKVLPGRRVGLLHGSLSLEERLAVFNRFRQHDLDVLVTTTVIEVGTDVPNATLMVVEGAERFGLAQLHQLRGRVGRSDQPAVCLFVTDQTASTILERLATVAATDDGLALAEYDLKHRGSGQLYGLRQSGLPDWTIASLEDTDIMTQVQVAAKDLFEHYPEYIARVGWSAENAVVYHRE